MPLDAGTRLGPYEIIAALGQGGMGEVYRARDTRLDRTVAVKVLPAALAADGLRARFEREARAISSIQHPHICALFDVGEAPRPAADASVPQEGTPSPTTIRYLVLEYLEGETLADRLARAGPLPVAEALQIAIEICDALDKAHRLGIVHRDLKPANVFLARNGRSTSPFTTKLLDFGLAKTAAPVVAAGGLSLLPTTPPNLTAQGTILGTFQYMAPEQIEGAEADARTDIFAFGALLFEMLTGGTAFEGKTRATLLGAILKDDAPSAAALRPQVPKAADRIIATCLAKDPDDRWQTARDLRRELKWLAAGELTTPSAVPVPRRRAISGRGSAIVLGAALLAAVGGIAVGMRGRGATPAESIQFAIGPPSETIFATMPGGGTGVAPQLAVSPDGRHVAFVAHNGTSYQLWLRSLGSVDARPLAGTDGASFPFWCPTARPLDSSPAAS